MKVHLLIGRSHVQKVAIYDSLLRRLAKYHVSGVKLLIFDMRGKTSATGDSRNRDICRAHAIAEIKPVGEDPLTFYYRHSHAATGVIPETNGAGNRALS